MDTAAIGLPVLVGLVGFALLFDFLNGLHDAANSIATVVSTRVLRPQTAVVWAAFFNFIALAVFGLSVAQTLGIVLSPLLGFVLAQLLVVAVRWTSLNSSPFAIDRRFRVLQLVSASLYSLGHGGNDAQKTMGIIAVLLYSQGLLGGAFHVPFWVVISCQAAMALGTLFGGWRIVHTMGSRITRLKPIRGFCAETGGAITLFLATGLGVPVFCG